MKMFGVCCSATIFFLLISSIKAHTQGTVSVDKFTFDSILSKFDIVFVKFDDKFPFGDKQENFRRFAEIVADTEGLLVAVVPITDHTDFENKELAEEYGIKKEDYPVYKLFIKNKSKVIDYTGDKTEHDLKRFIVQYTNLWIGLPGTLKELDFFSRDFFDATSNNDANEQNILLEKSREHVKGLPDRNEQKIGESYLKLMETTIKQGGEFLQRERRRVQNLLNGKLNDEKRKELQHRFHILLQFKPAKESITDILNQGKENVNTEGQMNKPVHGDKEL